MISVQRSDFDVGAEYASLTRDNNAAGAAVMFVGRVRDISSARAVHGLELEHYPGMTEKALQEIAAEAQCRWQILDYKIIHRIGSLAPGEQIVFVGVVSTHREDAFAAAEFLMDYLKTRAPFWKKEKTQDGDLWVQAQHKDELAAERWSEEK